MPHLSLVSTRLGTDPPASDVVPDVNLTAQGVLDWLLMGEGAVGDQNFKNGAVFITSIVEIGSPAPTRFAGSTDKQASLTSYTDGVSPASGGNRAWIGTTVNAAGWRITIALSGQSVEFTLGTGGYDGTHRVDCSLSDASAPPVSSDQVSGATAVGWWKNVILADATSDAANLIVDITKISGAGNACQFQHGYLTYGTKVIRRVTPTSPSPGDAVSAVLGGYAAAPLTANSLFAGIGITLNGGATNVLCGFTMPARSAFRFGGTHAAKRFYFNHDLVIANASETATKADVQVAPAQPGGFGARNAAAQSATPMGDIIDLLTWNAGAIALATADEVWGHITTGSGVINALEVNYEAYSDPMVIEWTFFDISAGSWSGLVTTTYSEAMTLAAGHLAPTPGQTVRLTLTGGPFALPITQAYIVFGVNLIPIAWTVFDASNTDVVVPDYAELGFDKVAEYLPFYANFAFRLVAGSEVTETPNTNQIVAPGSAKSGGAGSYYANFRGLRLPSELAPYFVRASTALTKGADGVYSTVLSGVPAFDGADGLILETASTSPIIQSGFAGAVSGTPGTAPTSWAFGFSDGTLAVESSAFSGTNKLRFTTSAARHYLTQTTSSLVAGTTYCVSVMCEVLSGTPTFNTSMFLLAGSTSFTTTELRIDGVVASGATTVSAGLRLLEHVFVPTGNGTLQVRLGAGCSTTVTVDQTFDMPQLEAQVCRTSYIPTTTAAVTRALSQLGAMPLTVLGLAAQDNEWSAHVAAKMLYSSAVSWTAGNLIFAMAESASNIERLNINYAGVGSIRLSTIINGNSISTQVNGLTWAAGDVLNVRFSKGATNGLILRVDAAAAATNTTANAKAPHGTALALVMLNSHVGVGSHWAGVYRGFKVWDIALSDAELSALSVGAFGVPVAGAIASVSALTGALSIGKTLAGAIASVSVLTGADKLQRQMLGDMQSVSEISGDAFLVQQLEGEIASQSELQGGAFIDMHMAGILPAVSQLTGQITGAANVPPGYLKASIRVYPV